MIPLIKLKRDVQFNREFSNIVDVLKGIAAARYHLLQQKLALFEPFATACADILTTIDFRHLTHPFAHPSTSTSAILLVTSDAGFLGGLNTQVVSTGLREGGAEAQVTVIGERGESFLRDLHVGFEAFPGIEDTTRTALAVAIRDHLTAQMLGGVCGRLVVVYPRPISFAVQQVTVETLIPCTAWLPQRDPKAQTVDHVWESRPEDVLEYVVSQWIAHRLDLIFALSRLAELAARAMHLEGSYQELVRLGKKLRLKYFRARHEVIDRSMREIFAAQLLYGKAHAD